ncbi:ribosome assembly RNA-binding protein YhbY, partial [Clostridium perfringens]|nr:ribosome assembly RNA-binding protein YhbY [Clostridium perfringens]
EASNFICERLGCEGVQSIGNKIVLYRASKNNPKIELPKKGK